LNDLNIAISDELGPGFEVGHSFFTPTDKRNFDEAWYKGVIEFEIIPLLQEYYFDDAKLLDDKIDILK
jgi:hypothetical protein